jgi:hypothetical protein
MLVYYRDNFGSADAHMDRHLVPRQMAAATPGPADWREALDIVALGLPDQVMLLLTCYNSTSSVSKLLLLISSKMN